MVADGSGRRPGTGDSGDPDRDAVNARDVREDREASRRHAPEHEPGAAIVRDDAPEPGPQAPDDAAPDLGHITSGDGPGQTPGQ
jgi:hypothetical protein